MKSKIAIVTCSNSGIDYIEHDESIEVLRSSINFGSEESYLDFIEMKNEEFYERIRKNPNDVPKTAYAPIGKIMEVFDELYEKGYEEVIAIVISEKLSNLCDAIRSLDGQMKIKVHAFNSKAVSYGIAYLVLEAQNLALSGASSDEIIERITKLRDNSGVFFTVDTLLYLIKNGRLSKFAGAIGSLLNIRPILEINKEGSVTTLEKQRGTKRAFKRVVELYVEATLDMKNLITYVVHANNDEAANQIKSQIQSLYPEREVVTCLLTPVVGAHAGPKAIGVGFIELD